MSYASKPKRGWKRMSRAWVNWILFSALLVFNYFDLPSPMESSGCTEGPEGAAEKGFLLSRVKHGGAEDSERVTLPNRDGSLG